MRDKPPKIFVSYSHSDRKYATRLESELKSAGAEVFVDYKGTKLGESFPKRINERLKWCNTLILLWSKESQESHWVEMEWEYALNDRHTRLIPCIVDSTKLPPLLTTKEYFDFRKINASMSQLFEVLELTPAESTPAIEPKAQAQIEARGKAEEERRQAEAKRKAEEERKQAEADAKRKAEEERKRPEAEKKRKAEKEPKRYQKVTKQAITGKGFVPETDASKVSIENAWYKFKESQKSTVIQSTQFYDLGSNINNVSENIFAPLLIILLGIVGIAFGAILFGFLLDRIF